MGDGYRCQGWSERILPGARCALTSFSMTFRSRTSRSLLSSRMLSRRSRSVSGLDCLVGSHLTSSAGRPTNRLARCFPSRPGHPGEAGTWQRRLHIQCHALMLACSPSLLGLRVRHGVRSLLVKPCARTRASCSFGGSRRPGTLPLYWLLPTTV